MPPSAANVDQPYHPQPMAMTGRIGRVHYWGWSTMLLLAMLALSIAFSALSSASAVNLDLLDNGVTIASIVGAVVLSRRRLQDVGASAWWALALIVPLVNLIVLVWLSMAPGQIGANRYGPEPAPASRAFVLASIGATAATIVAVLAVAYTVMQTQLGGDLGDLRRILESVEAGY